MATIYRLILQTAPGRVDTGATYPGCALNNQSACDPRQFATVANAVSYASGRGETPVQVQSADEAWQIAAGTRAVQPSQILSTWSWTTLLLIGGAAFLLLRR